MAAAHPFTTHSSVSDSRKLEAGPGWAQAESQSVWSTMVAVDSREGHDDFGAAVQDRIGELHPSVSSVSRACALAGMNHVRRRRFRVSRGVRLAQPGTLASLLTNARPDEYL
jgi:hypothetical protein